jgi:hypothetical protein
MDVVGVICCLWGVGAATAGGGLPLSYDMFTFCCAPLNLTCGGLRFAIIIQWIPAYFSVAQSSLVIHLLVNAVPPLDWVFWFCLGG